MRNLATGFLLLMHTALYAASVPPLIQMQGRLTDSGGTDRNGSYDLRAKVFSTLTGGTAAWDKTFTAVNVSNGLFKLELQDDDSSVNIQNAITSDQAYLELQVLAGPDVPSPETPLSPRQRIVSVVYSFKSAQTDSLTAGAIAKGNLILSNNGKILVSGTATPTVTCEHTASETPLVITVEGTDTAGRITVGNNNSNVYACTVNFTSSWTNPPYCFFSKYPQFNPQGDPQFPWNYLQNCNDEIVAWNITTTQLQLTTFPSSCGFAEYRFSYFCVGR